MADMPIRNGHSVHMQVFTKLSHFPGRENWGAFLTR